MQRLPQRAPLVNGADDGVHTQQHYDCPIMGSSEGAAAREAQATAHALLLRLITTTKEHAKTALEDAAYEIARLVGHGHLDRAEMADNLRAAALRAELELEPGEDAVQEVIASNFTAGERAAAEERAEEEEREAEARATDPWNDPDMTLLEDRRGDLPPFPVDALSPAWQPWLERAARGAGVMPDHVAVPLLAVAAGLIGAARRVRASRSWSEPLCLWTSVIGFSGTGKTPGLDVVRRVLSRIERGRSDDVGAARAAHDKKAAVAKAALKGWRKEVEEAIEAGRSAPERPRDADVPPPFVAPRFYVSDATIERLAVLIEARPRGILMVGDELAGLFANMGRYTNGGSDREFWLEAWNGGHYSVERLGRAPISLPHLLVSMTGGFQPDKLARSFDRADDGMYARHLFGWPAEPDYRPLTDEADEVDPDLQEALMRLIDLPAGSGSEIEPRSIPLKSCGEDRIRGVPSRSACSQGGAGRPRAGVVVQGAGPSSSFGRHARVSGVDHAQRPSFHKEWTGAADGDRPPRRGASDHRRQLRGERGAPVALILLAARQGSSPPDGEHGSA